MIKVLAHRRLSPAARRLVGSAMAAGETVSRGRPGSGRCCCAAERVPVGFARPTWEGADILDHGYAITHPAHSLLGDDAAAVLRAVAERIHSHGHVPDSERGLIHGDLHRENMLLTPEGTIAVIDFDDCGLGAYTLDIANVLSSIHRPCRDEPDTYATFASRFLTAYEKIRPLPATMDRLDAISFGQSAVADQGAGDAGEGEKVLGLAFVAAV
ncbi:phosphotransferase [Streptomyces sp. NBC_00513]|uniref:phosphotransferase enzyme family protein n=1 Tax=unclassified Streptomyces TaxID=2593676 RepID=UPI00225A8670|nr:phosphotransferase [Streptomyces sp. NBC_00424]MCX5079334.1 phosphotransferase [Streptomyces sp. NBC_00424]WUD39237.1 phosphotransferase [Streptomyces sp. NBC_00513]